MCDARELSICFSFWNIGEVLGVFDQYRRRRWITEQQHQEVVKAFSGECLRLLMLDALVIVPINSLVLAESWEIIDRRHIYQADAIQIVSIKTSNADHFLTADHSLINIARKERISAINIENSREVNVGLGVPNK
jgi:predicted nucleic acid-binding protein